MREVRKRDQKFWLWPTIKHVFWRGGGGLKFIRHPCTIYFSSLHFNYFVSFLCTFFIILNKKWIFNAWFSFSLKKISYPGLFFVSQFAWGYIQWLVSKTGFGPLCLTLVYLCFIILLKKSTMQVIQRKIISCDL